MDLDKINQELVREYGFLKIQEEIIKARIIAVGKQITIELEKKESPKIIQQPKVKNV